MTVEANAHTYLSTACHHGEHDYCAATDRGDGTTKVPGRCKFCPAACVCPCHTVDAVTLLATGLDNLGARIYRDLHVESSDAEVTEATLADFSAYAEECLAALDHPAVKQALAARQVTG